MRRQSGTSEHINLRDFGSYGQDANLRTLTDADQESSRTQSSQSTMKTKRNSFFGLSLDFGDELESTQKVIKAKEEAMKGAPPELCASREQKRNVAEHVVNDKEEWRKFRDQMRSGGARTGMQLKHNLDGLLQSTAQEMKTKGTASATKSIHDNRRASLTDFASTLIRGDDRRMTAVRQSKYRTQVSLPDQGITPMLHYRLGSFPEDTSFAENILDSESK